MLPVLGCKGLVHPQTGRTAFLPPVLSTECHYQMQHLALLTNAGSLKNKKKNKKKREEKKIGPKKQIHKTETILYQNKKKKKKSNNFMLQKSLALHKSLARQTGGGGLG